MDERQTGRIRERRGHASLDRMGRLRVNLLNLTYLAPKTQAEIIELEAVDGIEPMSERPLRRVLAEEDWGRQRQVFDLVVGAGR